MHIYTVATLVGIYCILTLGLNTVTGVAGEISLGHAAFLGIGAYTSAVLMVSYGWGFWPALAAAVIAAGAAGAAVGSAAIRARDDFLPIATMGVNFVVVAVFLYSPFFGGALGIGGIPSPTLLGEPVGQPGFFLLVVAAVLLCLGINLWLPRSWAGLALLATREDEDGAYASGVNARRFKIAAFTVGTALAGLAGGLYASSLTFISAADFGFPLSIAILGMLAFGGIGTNRGAIAGAIVLGVLPELFRPLADYRMLMYGGIPLLAMRWAPHGLLGDGSPLWRSITRRRAA